MTMFEENSTEITTEAVTEISDCEYVTDIVTENSELMQMYTDISELNEYVAVIAENTTEIRAKTEVEVILMFVVIAFIGLVSGLLITSLIRK